MATQHVKSKTTGRVIEVCDLTHSQHGEVRRVRLMKAAAGALIVAGGLVASVVLSALVKRPRI